MISVVIPCYNHEKYIFSAVMSARRSGAEEVIVVNDGSTDGTAAALAELWGLDWFKFVDLPNGGSGAARNAGFDVAHHQYVFFLDADDLFFPGALLGLEESLRSAPDQIGMACGWLQLIDPQGVPLQDITHPSWAVEQVPYWFIPNSGNHCIKKEWGLRTIQAYGFLYDTGLKSLSENAALWLRMHNIGCRALLDPKMVVQYRQHRGGSRSTVISAHADPRQRVWDLYLSLGYDPDIAKAISILTKLKRFHPHYGVSFQYLNDLFAQAWFESYVSAVLKYEDMLTSAQKAYWGNLFDFFHRLSDFDSLPSFDSLRIHLV